MKNVGNILRLRYDVENSWDRSGILTFGPSNPRVSSLSGIWKLYPLLGVQFPDTNLGTVITELEMVIVEVGKGAQGNRGE